MRFRLVIVGTVLSALAFGADRPRPRDAIAPKIPEDLSLTLEQYAENGVPDPAKPWDPGEFKKAHEVLAALAQDEPRQLPRFRSPRSGALFDRIAAAENLAPIRDGKRPARERAGLFRAYGGLVDIAGLYVEASSKDGGGSFDAELVELYVTVLHLHLAGAHWAEDAVATIPPDDPNRARRIGGVNGMRAAGAKWIRQSLQAFRSGAFRKSELLRFAEGLRVVVPEYLAFLSADMRNPVLDDLARLASTEPDPEVRAALKSLFDAAAAAPATRPAR